MPHSTSQAVIEMIYTQYMPIAEHSFVLYKPLLAMPCSYFLTKVCHYSVILKRKFLKSWTRHSARIRLRNWSKLVDRIFYRLLIAEKMWLTKLDFGLPKAKLFGKWPMADCYF